MATVNTLGHTPPPSAVVSTAMVAFAWVRMVIVSSLIDSIDNISIAILTKLY
jgi:hypothetical protein